MCYAYRLAYGEMTRRLVHPSLEWGVGSWWRDMPCFQTSLGRGRYFCQLPPQKQWVRRHLRRNSLNVLWHNIFKSSLLFFFFLKRAEKENQLPSQMSTHLHILLWCGVSHLDLCVPRWLSGCRESRRRHRPSWFFHSEPCPRWSPLKPLPCRWPWAPAAATDTMWYLLVHLKQAYATLAEQQWS